MGLWSMSKFVRICSWAAGSGQELCWSLEADLVTTHGLWELRYSHARMAE